MATDLTTIFGYEIKVYRQPRLAEIQFVGFPGADGVTGMNLGTRGSPFTITGRLSATGNTYDLSRANLDDWISDIEALLWQPAADYSFRGQTWQNLQFVRFELVPDGDGKVYHFDGEYVFVFFVMHGHLLI
jgi:hypothetical protein